MSKSEGNFVTIRDLLETDRFGGRKWPGEVLRLAMLMTHYREPIDFSVKRLEEAEAIVKRWAKIRKSLSDLDGSRLNEVLAQAMVPGRERVPDAVLDPLKDDLNTPLAIQSMQSMARVAEKAIKEGDEENIYVARNVIGSAEFLGIDLSNMTLELEAPAIEEALIQDEIVRRAALIREKKFAEADRIRDELATHGIQLMDYKDPDTGDRKTRWEIKR
jgi:cysteinyl-tRNA synthetase